MQFWRWISFRMYVCWYMLVPSCFAGVCSFECAHGRTPPLLPYNPPTRFPFQPPKLANNIIRGAGKVSRYIGVGGCQYRKASA